MYRRMTGLETYGAALCRAGVLAVILLLQVGVASAEVIDGEELKDPTRPMGAVRGAEARQGEGFLSGLLGSAEGLLNQAYTVSFIRAGGTDPVAMINDQLVRAGDRVGEAEVVAIDRDRVSLRINGEVRQVMSFDSSVKSRASTP